MLGYLIDNNINNNNEYTYYNSFTASGTPRPTVRWWREQEQLTDWQLPIRQEKKVTLAGDCYKTTYSIKFILKEILLCRPVKSHMKYR